MAVPNTYKLTATAATAIAAARDDRDSKITLQVSGTFVASMVPKAFLRGGAVASPGTNVAYTVAKTGVLTDGATTAITAAGIYVVALPAGCILALDTTYTSGTAVVDVLNATAA